MITINKDFVQTTVQTSFSAAATTFDVNGATSPFLNIPTLGGTNQVGYLCLTDDLNNPTKFEVISYTSYSAPSVNGVTRGLAGTTAQSWASGAFVYMAPGALNTQQAIWEQNATTGDISFQDGKVGIGTATPTVELEVVGDGKVDGNLTVTTDLTTDVLNATTSNTGATTTTTLHATGPATLDGGADITGALLFANTLPGGFTQQGLGTYSFGTIAANTLKIVGATTAGVGTATSSGSFLALGKILLLQFSIQMSWTSAPVGTLIITGYPSVGSIAGYVGNFSDVSGFKMFNIAAGGAIPSNVDGAGIIENSIQIVPRTIADSTNLGIYLNKTLWSYDPTTTTSTEYNFDLTAADIINTSTGVTVNGSIMFQSANEL